MTRTTFISAPPDAKNGKILVMRSTPPGMKKTNDVAMPLDIKLN
jgi:hypothetical protein